MVDFRRCITALGVLAVFAGLASAQGVGNQPLTCATNTTSTPVIRAEGYTELVGDITLVCSGGAIPVAGAAIPQVNITVFLNTAVTSRLLPITGGANVSEALLLIDEPGSGLTPATGPGTPFGPGAPQTVCATPLSGCGENVTTIIATGGTLAGLPIATSSNPGATTAANGFNVFQGVVSGNSVTWFGVPVLPPGTTGISRTFRLTNIRANATVLSGGSAAGATPVIASIAVSNTATLPVSNASPTVAFVQSGLTTAASSSTTENQCVSQTKTAVNTLTFTENFATAWKTRVVPGAGANSGQGLGTAQNVPGSIFNSESNFVLPVPGGGTAGLADFGTRLKATFNNVPTGVRLFVSVNNVTNGVLPLAGTAVPSPVGGNIPSTFAQLVVSESVVDTSGFFPSIAATDNAPGTGGNVPIVELPVTNGSALAVWEILNTNPNSNETAKFAVFTTFTSNVATNSPPPLTATVNLSFAPSPPAFTASTGAAASNTLPVPRFIQDPNAAKNIFAVAVCRTILLFPFVTNQAGFDTGLAIANTSTDVFGTGPQAGTCTLNWFSGGTAPPPTVSASVASGTVYTNLASIAVPGFQGYMIAVCQFQFAHGFAFISDLGARNLAMGYLALVIPDPLSQNNGVRNASANGCSSSNSDIKCAGGEEAGH